MCVLRDGNQQLPSKRWLAKLKGALRKLPPNSLRCFITIASLAAFGSASFGQTLYTADTRALPGDTVNLGGDHFPPNCYATFTQINPDGTTGTSQTVEPIAYSASLMQVTAPASLTPGLWEVNVAAGGTTLPGTLWINRPVAQFADADMIAPGAWFRVYGRNLSNPSGAGSPFIELVDPNGNVTMCPATQIDPYDGCTETYLLTAQMPSTIVAGTQYQVIVNNGSGGPTGSTPLPVTVTGHAPMSDPWGLNVPWASDLNFLNNVYNVTSDPRLPNVIVGDGVTPEQTALQADIYCVAKAGGGVVYLPAGTYMVGGFSELVVPSRVILKGAGAGSTILDVGYNYTPTSAAPLPYVWAIDLSRSTLCGLKSLTVQNLNTNATPNPVVLLSGPGTIASDRVFVKDCNLLLTSGLSLLGETGTHLVLSNTTVSLTTDCGPINMSGSMYIECRNCTMTYRYSRIAFTFTSNAIVEGSVFQKDNHYAIPGSPETGGLETSYARQILIRRNTIEGVGPFPTRTGDGELIDSQRAGIDDMEDLGSVTSATSTTLTNAKANWPTTRVFTTPNLGLFNRSSVQIVSGTGLGQTRMVIANTANTLNVDSPWQVIPDSTSVYSIGSWSADEQIFTHNYLGNSNVGINMNTGGLQCSFDSNQIVDAESIVFRCEDWGEDSEQAGGIFSGRRHTPGWDNWICNNTAQDTLGMRPPIISVYGTNVDGICYGNLALDNQIRNNIIKERTPTTTYPEEAGSTPGYWTFNLLVNNPLGYAPTGVMGTLFLGNIAYNVNPVYNILMCWPLGAG
jgi:hypothetical protein